MPYIEEKFNGVGKVIETYLDDRLVFKCKVETPDGRHAFPSVFLLNQDGGPNDASVDCMKELFGWDESDPNDLKTLAKGKDAPFYVKQKGEYWNAYFAQPSRQKKKKEDAPPASALEMWKKAKSGTGAPVDLSIPESSVPF